MIACENIHLIKRLSINARKEVVGKMKLTLAVFLFKNLQSIMEPLYWLLEGGDSEDREVILSLLREYFSL